MTKSIKLGLAALLCAGSIVSVASAQTMSGMDGMGGMAGMDGMSGTERHGRDRRAGMHPL